jgi:hypothetical protein
MSMAVIQGQKDPPREMRLWSEAVSDRNEGRSVCPEVLKSFWSAHLGQGVCLSFVSTFGDAPYVLNGAKQKK